MNITVTLNGVDIQAAKGSLISDLLSLHRSGTEMPCGGHGKCGKCRIIASGELSEITEAEKRLLGDDALNSGVRLACFTRAEGSCTVITSESKESMILTDGDMPNIKIEPSFTKYGVSIDIGTTTLASRLFDKSGKCLAEATFPNPQSVFGADVISRMEAALRGDGESLKNVTVKAIDDLLVSLSDTAKVSTHDIDGLVLTGNTVMLHLLTGTDVEPLTHAPFDAKRLFNETLKAKELSLSKLDPDTEVYLPSCIAAFIGADTSCAMLASSLSESSRSEILCDIGTNGEMVLSVNGKLYACSTAAGPAFEGAGISMGMAGKIGAIDHVILENGALKAHVIGNTEPIGICGSGIVDAAACLLQTGELDESGCLDDDEARIMSSVVLTQEDIRKIQLAKSAIHAGIRTLIHSSEADISNIDTLLIAGGFGSYLDTDNAVKIGLLPSELSKKIRVIGNAALTGASMLLLNRSLRNSSSNNMHNITVVELSGNPVFTEEYMERMMFE